ncbi:phosphoribosyl 1,2-cyclic phosphate phosphodiesterase [Thiothrix caldifontis]|uniref:Phosphoribosyl 1,2-cyclic phosphate phosphodiesterase n=1 Tax=Thiothrix caldifontis TaxID=525918 RepID=A0A1H4GAX0_9GAMM|nr:phosphonate metabolism protein PhnP [Thiothrix caldifontis]SEB06587.1 phosphoribosyl 1,2-cyclic phosphate phosphodiesterase [Thiothrix caldifontis]
MPTVDGLRLQLLGTGNAAGLPVYGCHCTACERARADDRLRRRPCSALLSNGEQQVLLDAGLMDLAERFPLGSLSHILLTHYHPDHVQGLFPLRWGKNTRIPVISPDDAEGCADLYKHPGILDFSQRAYPFRRFRLGGVHVTPLPLNHSKLTLGYCLEQGGKVFAYLTDTAGLQTEVQDFLHAAQPDYLVMDCSFPPATATPRGHNDLNTLLALHESIQPKQTVLTHLDHTLDVWLLENPAALPESVRVGFDGMVLA